MTATVTVDNPPGNEGTVQIVRTYSNLDHRNTITEVHPGESLRVYIYGDDCLRITEIKKL